MQPSTVSRIAPIVAKVINVDLVKRRHDVLDEIYECEALLYSALGDETREAFFIRPGCVPIVRYKHDCRNRCHKDYIGFSLPADVERAEVFRIDGCRVLMRGEHAGPAGGLSCHSKSCPEGIDLGQGWSLPVDPDGPCMIGFRLRRDNSFTDPEPTTVGVTYYDMNGQLQREDIDVSLDEISFTSQTVKVLAIQGISISPNRCHWLEVWQDSDKKLAEFHPSIDVPNFHRYSLLGPICADQIEFRDGQYIPTRKLYDSDTVVSGDPNLWRNLLQWKMLHYSTKRTPSEERSYASAGAFLANQAQQALRLKESDSEIVQIPDGNLSTGVIRGFRNLDRRWYRWRR